MTDVSATRPYIRSAGLDYSGWFMGGLTTFLATGEDTNGAFSLVEMTQDRGTEPPPHVHRYEDEHFYIVDGQVTFYIGGEQMHAEPGSWAVVPKGAVHNFVIETESARFLVFFTPSGFERFFMEMSEPATSLSEPPAQSGPPDIAHMISLAEKYGCTFLPPSS